MKIEEILVVLEAVDAADVAAECESPAAAAEALGRLKRWALNHRGTELRSKLLTALNELGHGLAEEFERAVQSADEAQLGSWLAAASAVQELRGGERFIAAANLVHALRQGNGGEGALGEPEANESVLAAPTIAESPEFVVTPAPTGLDVVAGRWGVDFGTSLSKLVFRVEASAPGPRDESAVAFPSVVAVRGDDVLFGEAALEVSDRLDEWRVFTSFKRSLVGVRLNLEGVPELRSWTTEDLVIAYTAWMLHAAADRRSPAPAGAWVHSSLPCVEPHASELRPPFDGYQTTKRIGYAGFLRDATAIARGLARSYAGSAWPSSLKALRVAVGSVREAYRGTEPGCAVITEPAAVLGEFPDDELPLGCPVVVVDCGAGTTDTSVFVRLESGIHTLGESSEASAGDVIDEGIIEQLVAEQPALESYRDGLHVHVRRLKQELFEDEFLDFDPAEVGLSDLQVVGIDLQGEHVTAALAALQRDVTRGVSRALKRAEARLLEAKPSGAEGWPTLANTHAVWLIGGSAAVDPVQSGVSEAVWDVCGVDPEVPPQPPRYGAWSQADYLRHAVALGASRPDIESPTPLSSSKNLLASPNSDGDKDA